MLGMSLAQLSTQRSNFSKCVFQSISCLFSHTHQKKQSGAQPIAPAPPFFFCCCCCCSFLLHPSLCTLLSRSLNGNKAHPLTTRPRVRPPRSLPPPSSFPLSTPPPPPLTYLKRLPTAPLHTSQAKPSRTKQGQHDPLAVLIKSFISFLFFCFGCC